MSASNADSVPPDAGQAQWHDQERRHSREVESSYHPRIPTQSGPQPPSLPVQKSDKQYLAVGGKAWTQQNCLSLDGGGIRGYWTLLALGKLMELIQKEEEITAETDGSDESSSSSFHPLLYPPYPSQQPNGGAARLRRYLPCHYFDYICGSSTGALIAVMLSTFRMTVDDCLEEYENLGGKIFGRPRRPTVLGLSVFRRNKYDAKATANVYEDLTRRRECQGVHPPAQFKREKGICQTYVTTYAKTGRPVGGNGRLFGAIGEYRLIRSYAAVHDKPDMNRNWLVQDVARAATAAEFYFEPLQIDLEDDQKMILKDGGMGYYNNPTQFFLDDVVRMHGGDWGNIGTVVSIGTARKSPSEGRTIISLIRNLIETNSDPEDVHLQVLTQNKARSYSYGYYRFNDPGGLTIPLDDWRPRRTRKSRPSGHKTLRDIRTAFNNWFALQRNSVDFEVCAKELVDRRRGRAHSQHSDLWQRFATASSYGCCGETFIFKSKLKMHLGNEHKDASTSDEGIARLKDVLHMFWQYRQPDIKTNVTRP